MQLKIRHFTFDIPERYSAGHPLTQIEADALNGLYLSNIRGNLDARLKDLPADQDLDVPCWQMPGMQDLVSINILVEAYALTYQFSSTLRDPLAKECLRIAKAKVDAHLRQKYGSRRPASITPERIQEILQEVSQRPEVIELAKANLDAAASVDLGFD